jgi:hypothetical protein
MSFDNGETWTLEFQISDIDIYNSQNVRFAKNNGFLHFVWEDDRDGNLEIYYDNLKISSPILIHLGLYPSEGDIFTEFNYNCIYYDLGNKLPEYVFLNIDGLNYTLKEKNESDNNFIDGKEYYFSTKLKKGINHFYKFYANNGENLTQSRTLNGPIVIPGPPFSVNVNPSNISITTNNNTQFNATVLDEANNMLNQTLTWEASGGGVIDQTGLFDPTKPGTWTIYANTTNGISGNTVINVTVGNLARIDITPQNLSITTDDFVQFYALGYDLDNNTIEMEPDWSVTGGGMIDQTGNFSATKPGIWSVYANKSGVSGRTTIEISIGKLARIDVIPKSPTITTDEYIQFNAYGYDSDNNSISIEPDWETTGGGTIDYMGNFTATTQGEWTIFANVTGISGNSTIIIDHGELKYIEILANQSKITTDDELILSAVGYDSDNNLINITPTWEITGGGEIYQNGTFVPKKPGTWTIYANYTDISSSIDILVTPGKVVRMNINPEFVELNISETVQFSVIGYDSDDNIVQFKPTWSVSGGGLIDNNGKFTAKWSGNWNVSASYQNLQVNATMRVNAKEIDDDDGSNGEPIEEDNGSSKGLDSILVYLLIVFIVLIFGIIILFMLMKKKKKDENLIEIKLFDEE